MIYASPQGAHVLKQAKSAKWYRRLKIMRLSMSGVKCKPTVTTVRPVPATIRSYIKAYNGKGIENLRPKK